MDRSEAKKIIERELPKLRKAMGLGHWDYSWSLGPCSSREERGEKIVTRAYCNIALEYEKFFIQIDSDEIDDEETLLSILRHELFHVVLAPFELVRETFVPDFEDEPPSKEMRSTRKVWHHSVEKAVIALERLWANGEDYFKAPPSRKRSK